MLKAKELVDLPFDYSDQMMWVNAMPASAVNLNLRPSS